MFHTRRRIPYFPASTNAVPKIQHTHTHTHTRIFFTLLRYFFCLFHADIVFLFHVNFVPFCVFFVMSLWREFCATSE
jgi:hypothetical protein